MKPLKKSSGLFAEWIDGNLLRQTLRKTRVWCALAVLLAVALIIAAVCWRQAEPEPVRYTLETAGNEINFAAPGIRAHTAEDGIAVVNMTKATVENGVGTVEKSYSNAASYAPTPAETSSPAAPVSYTADPSTIWQNEAAPTGGGFTMPVEMDGGSIGILTIPDIGLSVLVYESDDAMEDMDKGAAHFKSTSAWQGNIGLSAHNINFDGSAGYFLNLYTLKAGAVIQYETALGVREYAVESVKEIAETDWSMLGRTEDNRVTLITCVKGKPALRLCVQAVEKPR